MNSEPEYQQLLIDKIRDNYLSIALGVLVILIAVTLIFRSNGGSILTGSNDDGETTDTEKTMEENVYVVQPGESLSSIARDKLGDMERTEEIIAMNNITDPDQIEVGTKLRLPETKAEEADKPEDMESDKEDSNNEEMMEETAGASTSKGGINGDGAITTKPSITSDSYTVKVGDYLWDIAERAYGDGEMQVKIIEANNLTSPDHIEVGMTLTLPR